MCIQVVGRAQPHNQALLHPEQDRVMSIRESARMQVSPPLHSPAPPCSPFERDDACEHPEVHCCLRSMIDRAASVGVGTSVWKVQACANKVACDCCGAVRLSLCVWSCVSSAHGWGGTKPALANVYVAPFRSCCF